jgi:hypothetical protein
MDYNRVIVARDMGSGAERNYGYLGQILQSLSLIEAINVGDLLYKMVTLVSNNILLHKKC